MPMQLQQSTWPEVERYLETSTGVILPIGATEQHGPIGVIGTDAICAEVIAKGVGAAAGALVGPTIAVGMSEHHMRFPGSMTLRPSTLIALLSDCVGSLTAHGFRRFFFVNGHGGNIASLQAAFFEIYNEMRRAGFADAPQVRCKAMNWWQPEPVGALARELFGAADGSHAAASEVALTQFVDAANIKSAPLDPPVAPRGGFYNSATFRQRYPDGRIGSNSGLATPEAGQRLYDAAVAAVAADYQAFLAEA
ncbi:creatininase family protein [Shumkonia mesophila]|uniref:creatininase family protein n=1 Tax=Shumkonia mesophila TaxID=2838854 RepID=UPI002934B2DA|nr:creatininase family protein [Shumkonia mesophila]